MNAQAQRARYMTATHRRALDAAAHLSHLADMLASLLDEDSAPDEPVLQHAETWLASINGDLSQLQSEVKGLRHEQRLRRQGQL